MIENYICMEKIKKVMKKSLAIILSFVFIFSLFTVSNSVVFAASVKKPKIKSITANSAYSVTVKWSKVTGAKGYAVYQKKEGGSYSRVATITSGSKVSYTKNSLNSATKYYYKIKAYKIQSGKKVYSSYSNVRTVYTKVATPKVTSIKALSDTSVKVYWEKVPRATGYIVYRKTGGEYIKIATVKSTTKRSYNVKNLKENKKYAFAVRAYTDKGSNKIYSSISSTKTVYTLHKHNYVNNVCLICGKADPNYKPVDGTIDDGVFKIGFIFIHDEVSTYDLNFIKAAKAVTKKFGLSDDQVIMKTHVPESSDCYYAAVGLANAGCDIIFANSFGHESYMIEAAKKYPNVQFCHASGTLAHTERLSNFHNAYANIHEGRYLTGIAAGMKLNELIKAGKIKTEDAKIGFIGSFHFSEVISSYTAFYLGAKSVCPAVTMDVQYVGSWFDIEKEKEAAEYLIRNGAYVISQYSDSYGAIKACEAARVTNIAYNINGESVGPNSYLISSGINWSPYFDYIINCVLNGEEIATDWSKGIKDGAVVVYGLNEKVAAEGTMEAINMAKAKLEAGTLQVFNTADFTVLKVPNKNAVVSESGKLLSYMADVDSDNNFTPDTNIVSDGYVHECEYRSSPYFDLIIDGINVLNIAY